MICISSGFIPQGTVASHTRDRERDRDREREKERVASSADRARIEQDLKAFAKRKITKAGQEQR